jgi:type III secretion system (T3SS) SseB-like protein
MADQLSVNRVAFLREQDGAPERELTSQLAEQFKKSVYITAAYLAQVRYGDSSDIKVALCLEAEPGAQEPVLESVSSVFKRMFKVSESLDIIFLTDDQRATISRVVRPFYRQQTRRA